MQLSLLVNGVERVLDVPEGTSLTAALRDDLGLTGTHLACAHGACGACTVLVDGVATPSCTLPAEEAVGHAVVTVEGLAEDGRLSRLQAAFVAADAMQCGACTGGMLMAAAGLLTASPHPGRDDILAALDGHLCRCGVYGRVVEAVVEVGR